MGWISAGDGGWMGGGGVGGGGGAVSLSDGERARVGRWDGAHAQLLDSRDRENR